ncbi:hypothetical protein DNI29_02205 [Hymenobacter sediminis]|uniref:DUF5694 domain-containing protein n=1 Tax=Hymenobacter sediminis TaxID=2218621 RepID=UPI000DA67D8A|nr:DUF5694 domain-containing protein [Hymenobacter sediminis]RPD49634.1 hypothetical protein DNI29_02205 [Hymenobacter sediminis]
MRFTILFLLALLLAATSQAQTKPADLLLIGTFHFDNPGLDVSKINTMDVQAPKVQAELETMATRIAAFQPDKVFVEWEAADQKGLDDLYAAYLGPDYAGYVQTKFSQRTHGFYTRSEIVQLAFRAAKKAKLTKVYAMDYRKTQFPYDSVMSAMKSAHQDDLLQGIQAYVKSYEENMNKKLATNSITQLLLDENTKTNLDFNKGFYLNRVNRAGTTTNFSGPFLVSEWYRRNLYMYSIIQKTVAPTDDKVVVLVGSGHAAMMREFLSFDSGFRLKELKDVLKK